MATDEKDILVAINELDKRWFGTFLVVWPQAEDWPKELSLGDQGTAVSLVKKMAADLAIPYGDADGEQFDESFVEWVKAFQRRSGLDDDGIIGPETLVFLMAPGIARPRLIELPASM